jgi:hypothetical protein
MEEKCTICLKNIKTKSSKTLLNEKFVTKCKCKYYYHHRCIKTWMRRKKSCPTCRKTIFDNKYDMYENSMKNFYWMLIIYYLKFILFIHKPFLTFICIIISFSLVAMVCLELQAIILIYIRHFFLYTAYILWFLFVPTFLLFQFYRINIYA